VRKQQRFPPHPTFDPLPDSDVARSPPPARMKTLSRALSQAG
jgi:hypothetical protein